MLGPLLFLLYVNDISNVISDISNLVLYADETSLIITNSNSQVFEKIETSLVYDCTVEDVELLTSPT